MSTNGSDSNMLDTFIRVRRLLNLMATQELKRLRIGPKQALLLRELSELKTGSLAELSRRTATDPAATTRAMEHLLKKNWIKQLDDPEDRRRWNVSLTASGARMSREVQVVHARLAAVMFAGLSKKEKTAFQGVLSKIRNSLILRK